MLSITQPGTPVYWLQAHRGGYGYVSKVYARTVKAYESGRVKIAVYSEASQTIKHRTVSAQNLCLRVEYFEPLDQQSAATP